MKISRLTKFQNDILIDELVIEDCLLTVLKTGLTKYDFCFSSKDEVIHMELWTSQKGFIETHIKNEMTNKNLITLDTNGQLQSLTTECLHFHLGHMDRGHYWSMIEINENEKIVIHFLTRGYLKTKVKSY